MATYFLSRQTAVALILKRLDSLAPDGEAVPAGATARIAELEQMLRDVRLGRQDEFVLPGEPPMRIVVTN
ncbi:hypothetical protein [Burkholderia glumae]|uniref:hypothetical protein n=1 Tax=Burkholderia glumae TaxID=337 RepID=UPI00215176AF|nr:hypothetical protein [Burkholderia glumae]